jgi:hypothetical protein
VAGHSQVEGDWRVVDRPLLLSKRRHHFETRKILQQTKIWSWVPIQRTIRLAKTRSNLKDRIWSDPVYR